MTGGDHCSGTLVLHRDGRVAFCSAELSDGCYRARDLDHHATFVACTAVVPPGSWCPRCGPVAVAVAQAIAADPRL